MKRTAKNIKLTSEEKKQLEMMANFWTNFNKEVCLKGPLGKLNITNCDNCPLQSLCRGTL